MSQTSFYEQLHSIRHQLFFEHQPDNAWQSLATLLNQKDLQLNVQEYRALVELSALTLRAQQRYRDAADLYRENGDRYQSGYCELLLGNLPAAQSDWSIVLQSRNNHWCMSLYGMITKQLNNFATVLQIRNHLEADVASLLYAKRWDYLQNIILYADILAQMNLESMKFLGRGILNYLLTDESKKDKYLPELVEQSGYLLHKGQRVLPNDPEVYYHLGQYKVYCNEFKEAKLMLHQCLLISPTYIPAKELLQSLN